MEKHLTGAVGKPLLIVEMDTSEGFSNASSCCNSRLGSVGQWSLFNHLVLIHSVFMVVQNNFSF